MTWRPDMPQGNESAKTRWRSIVFCRGKGLDLGCGPEKLIDSTNCIGVDNNIDATLFGRPARFDIKADVTDLSMFASGSMDWVFSSHVLEHVPLSKIPDTLREWMRVIKPGGNLILYLPDMDQYPKCPDAELGIDKFEPVCNPDHKWNVSYDRVVGFMEKLHYNWDLINFERCSADDEYSLHFVFKRLK